MHEFIQNSATRFISCNFTRNSNTTRFRTAAPAEQVSNGSSWKHGGPGRAARLFSQHPGDVSSLPTDPRVYTRLYSRVARYARYPPRSAQFEAHSLGGPDIWVNVWPGDSVCNGIMRANRFTDFAVGKWTRGQEPQGGLVHPISTPNDITISPEYLQAKAEFDSWFVTWDENRAELQPDPSDMRQSVLKSK